MASLTYASARAELATSISESPEHLAVGNVHHPAADTAHLQQVMRLYDTAFDRDPDAGELAGGMNALNHGTTLSQVAQTLLDSAEFRTAYGPHLTDLDFVETLSWNAVEAAVDTQIPQGRITGVTALAQGTMTRADVLVWISEQPKHIQQAGNVHSSASETAHWLGVLRLYDTWLDLDPVMYGIGWIGIDSGIWGASAPLSKLAQELMNSANFTNMYGPHLTDGDFIETMYWNALGRPADPGGRTAALIALAQGTSRADLMTAISESPEHFEVGNVHQSATDTTHRLQLMRLYDTVFDRDADAMGLVGWMGAMNQGWSLTQVAQAALDSPEFAARYGTLSDSDFVQLLFRNAVNRAAIPAEVTAALAALAQGFTRADLVAADSESYEHRQLGNVHQSTAQLTRLYDAAVDRNADTVGLVGWMEAMNHDWSLSQVAQAFLGSAEFAATYGPHLTDSDFVETLYWNALNRPADDAGKASALNALAEGTSRANLLLGFSESPEHLQVGNVHQSAADTSHRLQLMRLYDAAFDRDADAGGVVGWMGAMNHGWSLTQVAQAALNSDEFSATYGSLSDSDFVDLMYQNALDRPAEADGKAAALNALAHGMTRATFLTAISESAEHFDVGNVHQMTQFMASSLVSAGNGVSGGTLTSDGSQSASLGTLLAQPHA